MKANDAASAQPNPGAPAKSSAPAATVTDWNTAIAAGEATAVGQAGYRTLFEQHFHPTVRLARLLGADDPEDIAQEAFVRLHRHHHRLHEPTAALAYLRRTTANLTTSRLRHLRVVRRTPGEVTRAHASAEDSVLATERVDHLLAAVQRLPRRQRHALVLRYWMDLPVAEIADALQVPLGTAKSDISRAQRALANRLEDLA